MQQYTDLVVYVSKLSCMILHSYMASVLSMRVMC